jgi:orotate phosphoribosyltransferase
LQARFGVPVVAIATLEDLMQFIGEREELKAHAPRVAAYRAQYGVAAGAGGAVRQQ